jgi:hypothetical protein
MTQKNTWSKKMRALDAKGIPLVCSVEPYEGEPVKFDPRYPTDREPWVLKNIQSIYRYNGREIHPLETSSDTTSP